MSFFRFVFEGTVQGVGFRPYIYRTAVSHGLKGFVRNIGSGVELICDAKDFEKYLVDLPPLAKISKCVVSTCEDVSYDDFKILDSINLGGETVLPADIFTCGDCIAELRDAGNRRHNYYFTTCTNCGPRFSMIKNFPYDRPVTAMDDYKMCLVCEKEYSNPLDRRYHAQTIACKNCGPKLSFNVGGKDLTGKNDVETVESAAKYILSGKSLGIKGVGGYHICSLIDDGIVSEVRSLLRRSEKPFAIMCADVDGVREFARVGEVEKTLLESPQRPIVVLDKIKDVYSCISELNSVGVMLPYTPLHFLLFDFIKVPLMMTSANFAGLPISIEKGVCNANLSHGRRIINRCDDSVIKVNGGKPMILRRSRGFVPQPIKLPMDCVDTIAVGAEMNNVGAVSVGRNCFLTQYIGNTVHVETFDFLRNAIEVQLKFTRSRPDLIACDLHPNYISSEYAIDLAQGFGIPLIPVQHHMAHIAGVAAEHDLSDYVGIACDGAGFGLDGKIWGGEIFKVKDGVDFKRVGGLCNQPQLGGDSAALHPKKMLFGILKQFMSESELLKYYSSEEIAVYSKTLSEKFNTVDTSSCGRILDAASAFLKLCFERTYDGRPAMLLESFASKPNMVEPKIIKAGGRRVLDTTELFRHMVESEGDVFTLAATAQMYLARGLYEIASGDGAPIVFSGGVAYNRMISEYLMSKGVLTHINVPAGDGGICFGQTILANHMF